MNKKIWRKYYYYNFDGMIYNNIFVSNSRTFGYTLSANISTIHNLSYDNELNGIRIKSSSSAYFGFGYGVSFRDFKIDAIETTRYINGIKKDIKEVFK